MSPLQFYFQHRNRRRQSHQPYLPRTPMLATLACNPELISRPYLLANLALDPELLPHLHPDPARRICWPLTSRWVHLHHAHPLHRPVLTRRRNCLLCMLPRPMMISPAHQFLQMNHPVLAPILLPRSLFLLVFQLHLLHVPDFRMASVRPKMLPRSLFLLVFQLHLLHVPDFRMASVRPKFSLMVLYATVFCYC
jgi:hypothetical protein